jgi:predicted dehydrogenase
MRGNAGKGEDDVSLKLAQVGYGYWGRNLMRVFSGVDGAEMALACDSSSGAQTALRTAHPGVEVTDSFETVLSRPDIDAVVLATPADQHYPQVKQVLEAGKHVFVEKPMARRVEEAQELLALAEKAGRTLMVGHTFLFNDAVQWVKDYIDEGELGEVYYAYFQRLNLGRVRQDVDALWNLAPHDISIALHWFGEKPEMVDAKGVSFLQPGIDDVSFLSMRFPSGRFAHVHVSWLDPFKTRRAVIVGSKKMVLYDDTSADMRIVVYDKGIDRKHLDAELGEFKTFDQFQLVQRAGDIWIPRIRFREPLKLEAEHFVEAVTTGKRPLADAQNGLDVVETLTRAQAAHQTA